MDEQLLEDAWFGHLGDPKERRAAASSVAAIVAAHAGVQPFPRSVQRLNEVARDPEAPLEAAVTLLESEPSIAARVLSTVNSATYGLRTPCTSIRRAVSLLGVRAVAQLASAAAVTTMLRENAAAARGVVEHSIAVAALARHFAGVVGGSPEDAYVVGLLHDLGRLMFMQAPAQQYEAALAEAGPHESSIAEVERRRYGFDHGVLAAHVMTVWKIPAPLPSVVGFHHQPERAYAAGGEIATITCLLRVCDRLADELSRSPRSETPVLEGLQGEPYEELLGLSAEDLAAMWGTLGAVIDSGQEAASSDRSDAPHHPATRPRPSSDVALPIVPVLRSMPTVQAPRLSLATPPPPEPAAPSPRSLVWLVAISAVFAAAALVVLVTEPEFPGARFIPLVSLVFVVGALGYVVARTRVEPDALPHGSLMPLPSRPPPPPPSSSLRAPHERTRTGDPAPASDSSPPG
jgi:putative nucleotidyltransferase with HDIG domain